MRNKVVIGLGGNVGNVEQTLLKAIQEIENQIGEATAQSRIYETEAWGVTNQPLFLNQVIIVKTAYNAHKVLKICMLIEQQLGRIRIKNKKWHKRVMDIDILFFNDEIINTLSLKVPHPYLHERNFVLVPLLDLMPNYVHPVLQQSITILKKECKDKMKVLPI